MGRVFAQWVIIYFGQWFEKYRSSAQFWATYAFILTNNWLGYILGDFFTYSTGRPARQVSLRCSQR
jgi:hypothetical protein